MAQDYVNDPMPALIEARDNDIPQLESHFETNNHPFLIMRDGPEHSPAYYQAQEDALKARYGKPQRGGELVVEQRRRRWEALGAIENSFEYRQIMGKIHR